MIQVLRAVPKREPFAGQFARQFASGLGSGISKGLEKRQNEKELEEENAKIEKSYGIKLHGIKDPETRKAVFVQELKGQQKQKLAEENFKKAKDLIGGSGFGLEDQFADAVSGRQELPKGIYKPEMYEDQGFGEGMDNISEITGKQKPGKKTPKLVPEDKIFQMKMSGNPQAEAAADILMEHNKNVLEQQRHEEKIQQEKLEKTPQYQRQQILTKEQAAADSKYYNDLSERRSKQILKKESLNRLVQMGKKRQTGKIWESLADKMGLTGLTSEGRREFSAEAKNQFTDFKQIAGSQLSASEFFILAGAYPNADFSPEANEAIAKNLLDVHDTLDKEEEIAKRLKKENGGKLPENYQEKVNEELQNYVSKKMEKMKERIHLIMREQHGTQPGFTLTFDNNGDPFNVPDDRLSDMLEAGLVNLP